MFSVIRKHPTGNTIAVGIIVSIVLMYRSGPANLNKVNSKFPPNFAKSLPLSHIFSVKVNGSMVNSKFH